MQEKAAPHFTVGDMVAIAAYVTPFLVSVIYYLFRINKAIRDDLPNVRRRVRQHTRVLKKHRLQLDNHEERICGIEP